MQFETYIQSIQKNIQRGSERTHYPALKKLLDESASELEAIIEEKGNKAGIPDFTVRRRDLLVGYMEAKDVGLDLDAVEKTEQIERYRESLNGNLILTNYLEFRWYVQGKKRLKAVLAQQLGNRIQLGNDSSKVAELINGFLNYSGAVISSSEDLAKQMARLTRSIRLAIVEALKAETESGELHQLKRGFNEILLPDLNETEFADMYAQTLSYGLFAARVGHAQNPGGSRFDRRAAGTYIPATNPFLRRLFNTLVETDAIAQINWAIDDLVQLLERVDIGHILENFGRRTRQEDAIVHFYETFLAAYDAALRKSRGVYYTPEPVVSFIVRAVDAILKNRFHLPLGLADNSKDSVTQQPRVQILDPATGTGTFLYMVVNQIYQNLEEMGMAGAWNQYVRDNLLSRLFGFELLMAPYAIAHLKLGWQLQNFGYQFTEKQRLGIYLTNTLDEALKKSEVLFAQFVAQEANEASAIKRDVPVMVVLGNPPYSGNSANKSEWIAGLVRDYYFVNGVPLGERNPKFLQDDYVKFIRFGQWRISQTGSGILAFITNHGYLDNPTFRGMRQNLMQTFTDIYILDLHGNPKKKEISPDGSPDKNVFDIQQGVSIGIFIKEPGKTAPAKVHHAELWGDRAAKYEALNLSDINDLNWKTAEAKFPFYLFYPQENSAQSEYEQYCKITNIMPFNSTGVKTHRDRFVMDFDLANLRQKIENFRNLSIPDEGIAQMYDIGDTRDWKLKAKRHSSAANSQWKKAFTKCLYRPFDWREYYHHEDVVELPRTEVMRHLLAGENIGLCTTRQVNGSFTHIFCTEYPVTDCTISIATRERTYVFPLYLYPDTENEQGNLFSDRTPNFSSDFLSAIRKKLGYLPAPEAIFYYAYAVFHSPTYRQRYAEFLKIDFPRLPLTSNKQLFQALSEKGRELADMHLMKSKRLDKLITKYPASGDNAVTEVSYNSAQQRVDINKQQYFAGISPPVWEFKIGGYQVLEKWLKDRKFCGGNPPVVAPRCLSFDDILHYQRVVVALKETMQIMTEIEALIPNWPLQ